MASTQKIFEKELCKSDTEYRLAFPSRHIHHICNNSSTHPSMDFQIRDVGGLPFQMRLIFRNGRYKKPEIISGWRRFVNAKGLKPRDKVVLYKQPGRLHITIAIRRAVRVFGAVLGHMSAEE